MYSSPPRHGAEIAELVLSEPQLYDAWKVRLGPAAALLQAVLLCPALVPSVTSMQV